jgi:hypothetical protein
MRYSIIIMIITAWLLACNSSSNNKQALQNRVDSLEKKITDAYKPGFGEFMSSIQVHHAKLWFAVQDQNWKLADFEIHEIMETVDNIQKYETERKESQQISMLSPALDSVNNAIKQKNPVQFKNSFVLLTSTCNNCHHAVQFEFNVVKIPDGPPFTNQDFKPDHP